ncbi:MAG: DegT/DnrJ/EryC1/StrS family aminotransferase [Holophaga sp.]|nr:DegT/DnrJ/EryC1/StrS family aminotransferase [Holophaga sp.]
MTQPPKYPVLDLQPQIQTHWAEFQSAFQRVLQSGQFILGPEEHAFESECATYLGAPHAIGLNSGTDALFIALRALNIGPGDEVITTPFTFFATAEAISHVGATPVFVDIDEGTFNLNPSLMEPAITTRTRAIIPVHLFGRPVNMDPISSLAEHYGIKVIEDCAQCFGAPWGDKKTGSLGEFGCFSFFPTKNLSAFGDGGMIVTHDDALASRARMLRAHGSRRKYFNEEAGYNSRLDELQAAMLRVKLPHLDGWNQARRVCAERYNQLLTGIPQLITPDISEGHVFHQYTIRLRGGRRDLVQAGLAEAGIASMIYYPVPVHRLKLYEESHRHTSCPVAEQLATEVLSLPIYPELPLESQVFIASTLRQICRETLT